MSSTTFTAFIGLLRDNPVLHKDASLLLRRKLAAAAWLVVAFALLCVAGGSYLDISNDDLRQWGTLDPPGGGMLIVLTGVLLVALTVLVPALASTSIASERESGTLPLLIVSGLTPERLIVGKIGALFTAAAPFLALTLPLFALCGLFLGVDVSDVALAGVAVFVHALTLCCVGVWASAVCDRTRSAVLVSLIAAAVPSIFGAIPVFIALVSVAEDRGDRMLAVGVVGAVTEIVIGLAAVVGAWSALAPRSASRRKPARLLLIAASLGVPVFAAACLLLAGEDQSDVVAGVYFHLTAFVVGVVAIAPVIAGRRPLTPTPLSAALSAVGLGLLGLALASIAWTPRIRDDIDAGDIAALVSVFVAVGGVAAFAGRWFKSPVVGFLLTAGVFITLFAIPGIIDEFVMGDPPLALLNLAYVVDRSSVSPGPTVFFYGVLALVTFLCARGSRRV
ncbi:MAG: ABC transporter permease [Deltaproteobacteria bacterium]|nr:ABC transporter permease [Deltaproteobacteria bacterium]